ncbi:HNH endonuclease [Gordonibacter sp.]|nr:HNH endonuclease [Gordonibacter sp.]
MREVQQGDLIISCLKEGMQHFAGISIAGGGYIETDDEPTIPGKWAKENGYTHYYKIPLIGFSEFENKLELMTFIQERWDSLPKDFDSFYTKNRGVAQKYLTRVPKAIFFLIKEYLEENGVGLFDNILIKNEEDSLPEEILKDSRLPKVTQTVTRCVRDTKLSKNLKDKYKNVCQICGKSILLPSKRSYSEGHHIRPLGAGHNGPDVRSNIMVLCPTHHVEFDYGCIAINPSSGRIEHIDSSNEYHNRHPFYDREELDRSFFEYHYQFIFRH